MTKIYLEIFFVQKLLKIFCAIEFIDLDTHWIVNWERGFTIVRWDERCVYWNHGKEVPVCTSGWQCRAYHDFTSHGPFPWFQWGALFYFPLTKQHHSFGQNTAALHWLPTTVKNKQNLLLYQHGPSFTKIDNIKLWSRRRTRHSPPQSSSLLPFTNQSPHLLCDCEGCGRGTFLPVRFPGRDMIRHERHSRHALHHFHSKNFHRHALGRL